MTDADQTASDSKLITCNQCGHEVPRLKFCVRCGDPLADEYAAESVKADHRRFAAAPHEGVTAVALISTFFPQLPRADMHTFRLAFGAGVALIVVLALLGLFPVALISAAVLVPLLMVLYLWDVDVYENEPISVIGATMLWGALAGILFAYIVRSVPNTTGFGRSTITDTLITGVGLPVLEAALMVAGPLLLLRWRAFNDVLDGATFGAASAVTFSGATTIMQSLPLFAAGLRPAGDPLPWIVKLLSLGILEPVIAGGAIGGLAAAVWLRYRAPVRDRQALGVVGQPVVALIAALVLFIAAALAKTLLGLITQTIVLAVIAVIALLWLRLAIHVGLLEESREIGVVREMQCPNCGLMTPEDTFCGQCGISLRALPTARRATTPAAADSPATTKAD